MLGQKVSVPEFSFICCILLCVCVLVYVYPHSLCGFLSLHLYVCVSQGAMGPKGEAGMTGTRGPTGRPGKRGKQVKTDTRTNTTETFTHDEAHTN